MTSLNDEVTITFCKATAMGPALRIRRNPKEAQIRVDLHHETAVIDVHLEGAIAGEVQVAIAIGHPNDPNPERLRKLAPVILSARSRWERVDLTGSSTNRATIRLGHELYFVCPAGIALDGVFLNRDGRRERVELRTCKYGLGPRGEPRFTQWEKDRESGLRRYSAMQAELSASVATPDTMLGDEEAALEGERPDLFNFLAQASLQELGNLSEEALASFTVFFLKGCIDEVKFMAELMQPSALRKRSLDWAKDEERIGGLMPNSTRVLAHILTHRELERRDVTELVGFDDRKSRRVTAMLHKRGIIAALTHRAAFRIAFPAALAPGLMPGPYPRLPRLS
jgi:hypothetical protein